MAGLIGQDALILALAVALAQGFVALAGRLLKLQRPAGFGAAAIVLQLAFTALAVLALLVLGPVGGSLAGPAWIGWAILTLMTVLAVVVLILPLARWAPAQGEAAERKPPSEKLVLGLALGLATVVVIAGAGLVAVLNGGRETPAPQAAADHPGGDIEGSVRQLEAHLAEKPDDGEGWATLGWSYMRLARYDDAVAAYGKAVTLAPARADLFAEQGQALMEQAGGRVTPAAKLAFDRALTADPQDPAARYFLALARDQGGDAKGAMDDWVALVNSAPPGAPWAGEIRARVEQAAAERRLDISDRLPPAPRGPTAEEMAAGARKPLQEQRAMAGDMVAGLERRLKDEPRDPAGWEMLMRSRVSMGQMDLARQAYRDARAAYAGDESQQARFRQAAASMGISGL